MKKDPLISDHPVHQKRSEKIKDHSGKFHLVIPKGLTNGGSYISGRTNLKNQKVDSTITVGHEVETKKHK